VAEGPLLAEVISTAANSHRSAVGAESATLTVVFALATTPAFCTHEVPLLFVSRYWWTIVWPLTAVLAVECCESSPAAHTSESGPVVVSDTAGAPVAAPAGLMVRLTAQETGMTESPPGSFVVFAATRDRVGRARRGYDRYCAAARGALRAR
jgi:hypothetical protein